jgi:hypothetical protein
MVGGTCRGAAVFSLYFQRRPGGSYRPDLASVRKLWMVGGTCRGAAVFSLYEAAASRHSQADRRGFGGTLPE